MHTRHESSACLAHKRVQVLAGINVGTNAPARSPARRTRVDNYASLLPAPLVRLQELHNADGDDDAASGPPCAAPPESRPRHRGVAGLPQSYAESPRLRRITGCRRRVYSAKLTKPVAQVE